MQGPTKKVHRERARVNLFWGFEGSSCEGEAFAHTLNLSLRPAVVQSNMSQNGPAVVEAGLRVIPSNLVV